MRRAGTGFFDGLYSLPGGRGGGRVDQAARDRGARDARRNSASRWRRTPWRRCSGWCIGAPDTNRIDFFLRAQAWVGTPRIAEPHKCDDLGWLRRDGCRRPSCPTLATPLAGAGAGIREAGWAAIRR